MVSYKLLAVGLDLVPYLGKGSFYFCFRSGSLCRIREILMEAGSAGRKVRAVFLGMVAYSDDVIKKHVLVLINVIGSMTRDIDAIFGHSSNRLGIDTMRFNASTIDVDLTFSKMPEVAFGQLAPAGVAGAQYKNVFHDK